MHMVEEKFSRCPCRAELGDRTKEAERSAYLFDSILPERRWDPGAGLCQRVPRVHSSDHKAGLGRAQPWTSCILGATTPLTVKVLKGFSPAPEAYSGSLELHTESDRGALNS